MKIQFQFLFTLLFNLFLLTACQFDKKITAPIIKSIEESISEDPPLADCVVSTNQNGEILNPPCVLKVSNGYYLSEKLYSGRDQDITNQTVSASTILSYDESENLAEIQLTSDMPQGWSNNQEVISLDLTTTQQGGEYNPDFLAENIRSDVQIFGINGTFPSSQKPSCSVINTSSSTALVPNIDDPADPAQRVCLTQAGSFIYSSAYGGRNQTCNLNGNTNTQSCFVNSSIQNYYAVNANNVPFACTSGGFYDTVWNSSTFGKLNSPIKNGTIRNYCQVASNQYFYPDVFGGRGQVCGSIPAPPCWLVIPSGQTRTVMSASSSNNSITLCTENYNDSLPANYTGFYDEPPSQNNNKQCVTAGSNRYVYTKAYDGRFRECNGSDVGLCYFSGTDKISNIKYSFSIHDNSTCRSNLNTCQSSCESTLNTCTKGSDVCINDYSKCYDGCYTSTSPVGYLKCMDTAKGCTTTKTSCLNSCNSFSGTSKTNCQNTCNKNFTGCTAVENPRKGIWYLDASLKLVNPSTNTLIVPTNTTSATGQINLSQLLHTNVIKAGVNILGVTGSFGGQGVWSSGMHRDYSVNQLTLSQENNSYAGSSEQYLPTSINNNVEASKPYREIPSITKDDEGQSTSTNIVKSIDRSFWGNQSCGVENSLNTIDLRIADCNKKFGSDSIWDGAFNGHASQGRWTLITRLLDSNTNKMVEVWRDDRTGMFWSSLISENINWCKASGSSNNPSVATRYREDDPNDICDASAYQEQLSLAISACLSDVGFSSVDASITQNGKANLNSSSTPKVRWRIPTIYDYEIAEYNGIRFVLPDMGTQSSNLVREWTGSMSSQNKAEAWTFNSTDGAQRVLNRSDVAGVRCIGR